MCVFSLVKGSYFIGWTVSGIFSTERPSIKTYDEVKASVFWSAQQSPIDGLTELEEKSQL